MSKAADLAAGKIAAVKTALIEFTDGDDAIAVADAGVVTLLTTAVAKSEGGAVTTNIAQGLAKVWCHLDLNTENTIDDSLNTATITDSSTGRFLVTNTSAMASINYTITGSCWNGNDNEISRLISPALARTTAIAKLADTYAPTGTLGDGQDIDVIIHGDLA